jgi:hypothetical protein
MARDRRLARLRSATSRSVASRVISFTRRLDQHVRQDGNRVLALDDLLEELQFTHKIGFSGDQFHVGA